MKIIKTIKAGERVDSKLHDCCHLTHDVYTVFFRGKPDNLASLRGELRLLDNDEIVLIGDFIYVITDDQLTRNNGSVAGAILDDDYESYCKI